MTLFREGVNEEANLASTSESRLVTAILWPVLLSITLTKAHQSFKMANFTSATTCPGLTKTITFNARGMERDVDLEVLGTHMYVHSAMLKLHSVFFYKFLDSADKALAPLTPPNGFRYTWVTSVDIDGTWALVDHCSQKVGLENIEIFTGLSSLKQKSSVGQHEYKGDKNTQINAFHNLLCAIYGERFEFQSIEDLVLVTNLADYYCALPVVSKTIDGALLRRPISFKNDALVGLQVSYKLRHAEILRECVCFLAGNLDLDLDMSSVDSILRSVVDKARQGVYEKLARAHIEVMRLVFNDTSFKKEFNIVHNSGISKREFNLPRYYAKLFEEVKFYHQPAMWSLMDNNLMLERGNVTPGEGVFGDKFLCAVVSDDDLPWDVSQLDW